ncbi:uncharacterized protein TRIVIDRAFT_50670 [Trichoderma virens Gv29-8]|uniref:Copper acquisition factor BIM1-like domain-containing protein n=1 Tax=Hypocrea virens (strain Gv29-8 / FGSC 10586) TaxID=413071 RepID=G9N1X6_HYPVG|nr:uncharacterized protein TRIVIDRAFT_50670 [Trichoderma virens Gv29-8]EHK19093.1 hypothetical protein TRIVIDRAFT_50670 [Trichoderma virens Gv29-8]UKZ49456.1 hypothetical protein TrVGV298_003703 [Trichoderma virens]
MAFKSLLLGLAAVQSVTAHFGVVYPEWRADTLAAENEDKYSQWNYPCGGVPYKAGNITNWPIGGGGVELDLHHPWTYLFINLGLGANTTNFNISLTPELTNVTGKGTLCIDKLPVPLDSIADGTLASIQFVTSGESGSALYNCADIRFTKNATGLSNCSTSDGLVMHTIKDEQQNGTQPSQDGASGTEDKKNAAGILGTDKTVLATVVGLAVAFSLGLGI